MIHRELKPWLDIEPLLQCLRDKGIIFYDIDKAKFYLRAIGYYRLSGYVYPFKIKNNSPSLGNSHKDDIAGVVPGTSFDDIIALYEFDKKLRLLVLEAVFEVEVYAKAKVCHALGRISPISYENSSLFLNNYCYDEWMIRQEGDIAKNEKNAAVSHYEVQYGKMPIWVASEVWSFGTLVYLYGYLLEKYQNQIAKSLRVGVSEGKHLRSHLKVFNFVRNTAAHHAILWNVALRDRPTYKGFSAPEWRSVSSDRLFGVLCLLNKYLKVICPESSWGQRVCELLKTFPKVIANKVHLREMGFDVKNISLLK